MNKTEATHFHYFVDPRNPYRVLTVATQTESRNPETNKPERFRMGFAVNRCREATAYKTHDFDEAGCPRTVRLQLPYAVDVFDKRKARQIAAGRMAKDATTTVLSVPMGWRDRAPIFGLLNTVANLELRVEVAPNLLQDIARFWSAYSDDDKYFAMRHEAFKAHRDPQRWVQQFFRVNLGRGVRGWRRTDAPFPEWMAPREAPGVRGQY